MSYESNEDQIDCLKSTVTSLVEFQTMMIVAIERRDDSSRNLAKWLRSMLMAQVSSLKLQDASPLIPDGEKKAFRQTIAHLEVMGKLLEKRLEDATFEFGPPPEAPGSPFGEN